MIRTFSIHEPKMSFNDKKIHLRTKNFFNDEKIPLRDKNKFIYEKIYLEDQAFLSIPYFSHLRALNMKNWRTERGFFCNRLSPSYRRETTEERNQNEFLRTQINFKHLWNTERHSSRIYKDGPKEKFINREVWNDLIHQSYSDEFCRKQNVILTFHSSSILRDIRNNDKLSRIENKLSFCFERGIELLLNCFVHALLLRCFLH